MSICADILWRGWKGTARFQPSALRNVNAFLQVTGLFDVHPSFSDLAWAQNSLQLWTHALSTSLGRILSRKAFVVFIHTEAQWLQLLSMYSWEVEVRSGDTINKPEWNPKGSAGLQKLHSTASLRTLLTRHMRFFSSDAPSPLLTSWHTIYPSQCQF